MSGAKLAACCGVAAIALSACGSKTNPVAGSISPGTYHAGHAAYDDPRTKHVACLRDHHVPFTEFGLTGIQIGRAPTGASVVFTPTPGSAQQAQISGQAQGAEVIGAALMYPNQSPEPELQVVENCVALQVKG